MVPVGWNMYTLLKCSSGLEQTVHVVLPLPVSVGPLAHPQAGIHFNNVYACGNIMLHNLNIYSSGSGRCSIVSDSVRHHEL